MKNRKYYEQLFNKYPDVVTLSQFRNMLGVLGRHTDSGSILFSRLSFKAMPMTKP